MSRSSNKRMRSIGSFFFGDAEEAQGPEVGKEGANRLR